jgi:uncharacterized protein YecE (DUF72 family)
MRLKSGTSGFSYDAWNGTFYPDDLPAPSRLQFYAERLNAVEINNTFYRLPDVSVFQHWITQVPAGFTFAVKAPMRITHTRRLRNAAEPLDQLLAVTEVLAEARGPLLFGLHPNMKKDIPLLADFLALLPSSIRAAFEFRHASWFDDVVYDALRSAGVALCVADTDEASSPIVPTASWGYLRLRREVYQPDDLRAWVERVRSQPWLDVFAFFKHENAGTGPRLARAFEQLFAAPAV